LKIKNRPQELPFTGRVKELAQLKQTLQTNMSSFLNRKKSQHFHKVDVVTGGLGVGKTRLVRESNWRLCSSNATFVHNSNNFLLEIANCFRQ
jgi:predicted ATPase